MKRFAFNSKGGSLRRFDERAWGALILLLLWTNGIFVARAGDAAQTYRITAFPWYTFTNHITLFAHLGSSYGPDKDNRVSNLISPGMYYTVHSSVQLWGGFNNRLTFTDNTPDQFEIRPFIGAKVFVPNDWDIRLYEFVRYEYRAIDDIDVHEWSESSRIRMRSGVEVPLTSRENAWAPQTLYSLAYLEPFFRLDKMEIDPLRITAGLGYVLNERIKLEFLYHAKFARVNNPSLEFAENIFRINIKIELSQRKDRKSPDPGL